MMRTIGIQQYGDWSVVEEWELPVPSPGPGEVLVHVSFAGINFMDVHTRQGKYKNSSTYPVRLPTGLGMEGAGVVTAVGQGTEGIRIGDRVAWCLVWGSYADYIVVPVEKLTHVPDSLDLRTAAATVFPGLTAHYLATDVGQLASGDACLIHAASGTVGRLLLQLALAAGATTFVTASHPSRRASLSELGAHHVLDYAGFESAILERTSGRGVDVVFDALGSSTLRRSFIATRQRGLVVNYGSVAGPVRDLDPIELGESGSLFLTRPRLADHIADGRTFRRRAAAIFDGLIDGTLTFEGGPDYEFDSLKDAHMALEERRQHGKSILNIGNPSA